MGRDLDEFQGQKHWEDAGVEFVGRLELMRLMKR
jgi:hypothetical protein